MPKDVQNAQSSTVPTFLLKKQNWCQFQIKKPVLKEQWATIAMHILTTLPCKLLTHIYQ